MRQKRKLSSCTSQVCDSQSTSPTSNTNTPISAGEENAMPERKRMKKESFEMCQQVEDQATLRGLKVLPSAHRQQVRTSPAQVHHSSASADNVDLTVEDDILSRCDLGLVLGEERFGVVYEGRLVDDLEQSDGDSKEQGRQQRKSSFDKKGSIGQTQQVQNQTTAPEHKSSASDESKGTSLSLKRRRSSHSAEVCVLNEEDEGQKRKKRRTDVEEVSSFFFFDQRGSQGQAEVQKVQDQAAEPLNKRCTEDPNLQDSSSAVEDKPVSSGLPVCPQEIQQNIFSRYEIGRKLGEGGFGNVYEGKRLADGLQVAIKIARKKEDSVYINIPGHPASLPLEVGLLILVSKDTKVPHIIELLDWEDQPDQYILVLERPSPCEDLWDYIDHCGGTLNEDVARIVMRQAMNAAVTCCHRNVFHRDIKSENLLINTETLDVNLIDFGCGDLLGESGYNVFCGTREYIPPEYTKEGWYHGKPATVWSLGVLLFEMVCGRYPERNDLMKISRGEWFQHGLSDECCHLISSLMQEVPSRRIGLNEILLHSWFIPPRSQAFLPSADVRGHP